MSWIPWRKRPTAPTPSPVPEAPPPPATVPTPESDAEAYARWSQHWARVNEAQTAVRDLEAREEDERRRDRATRERERLIAVMARHGGSVFPGDDVERLRERFAVLGPEPSEAWGGEAWPPPTRWLQW